MPSDLDYFYESDLDKTNLEDFYDKLPSSRLQSMFKASLYAEILSWNVLQGYRGPSHMCNGGSGDSGVLHESHGLQEIKFWWAIRKDVNYFPGPGNIIYTDERIRQSLDGETDWSSLYFDSQTGECLGHDRNEAKEKLKAKKLKVKKQAKSKSEKRNTNQETADHGALANNSDDESDHYTENYNRHRRQRQREERAQDVSIERERLDKEWAANLYHQGNHLFYQGRYAEAKDHFQEAFDILDRYPSSNDIEICHSQLVEARNERIAEELNIKGICLFEQGYYQEARDIYQKAYELSKWSREKYMKNRDEAQNEIVAEKLNSEGDESFRRQEFSLARYKYDEASCRTKVYRLSETYKTNRNNAAAEVDANEFSSEGYYFFSQRWFDKAHNSFQKAFNRSRLLKKVHAAYRDKAQAEINAMQLKSEGDNFFQQGKYVQAHDCYQRAFDTSGDTKEKNRYNAKKDETQTIIDILKRLDTLWQQAWDAENDQGEKDRSDEAERLFNQMLNESRSCSESFPNILKIKQYVTLVSLKTEGNKLCNDGLKSQLDAVKLFQEALQLKQQQKYLAANNKFKEAKTRFLQALEKFMTGSKSDQRFVDCVNFVQGQIDMVTESIEMTDQKILSLGLSKLNVNASNHQRTEVEETRTTGMHNNYYQQI